MLPCSVTAPARFRECLGTCTAHCECRCIDTDAKGRYTFETIRPASYPDATIPQHIHMHVIERGCATYYIDELVFTDDPFFQRQSPEERARSNPRSRRQWNHHATA